MLAPPIFDSLCVRLVPGRLETVHLQPSSFIPPVHHDAIQLRTAPCDAAPITSREGISRSICTSQCATSRVCHPGRSYLTQLTKPNCRPVRRTYALLNGDSAPRRRFGREAYGHIIFTPRLLEGALTQGSPDLRPMAADTRGTQRLGWVCTSTL